MVIENNINVKLLILSKIIYLCLGIESIGP